MTTSPTSPDHAALGALAEEIAREAGALLLDGFEGIRTVDLKSSPTDVVTEMDRAAEALIVRRILEARPDDGILGEEGADRPSRTGVRWVIDPLDGTVNYLYRRADWAVSIGIEVDGVPAAGAVFAPVQDELFAATLGGGATRNGAPIHVSTEARVTHALVGTGFGYEEAVRKMQGAVVARLIGEVRDIRRNGSAALDLCALACGRLDAYYERGVHLWDIAAAGLVVREAGGHAETLDKAPLSMESTWVGTNGPLYLDFRALLGGASGLDPGSVC